MIDCQVCLRLTGGVRLEHNGGLIQMALNLTSAGDQLDVSDCTGVRLSAHGNSENYSIQLRTADNIRPWQSYRSNFTAGLDWETIDIPFDSFKPYQLEVALDITRLRRIGLVAIGRAFHANLAVSRLEFYR